MQQPNSAKHTVLDKLQLSKYPDQLILVNDLAGLPKPTSKQYICQQCHQLQDSSHKSRHMKKC